MISVDSFNQVINECSSKGNQHKFYKDGYWVKVDNQYCYEGIAEEFVSLFESCIYDFPYVEYKTDTIIYNDNEYLGCYSYNIYNNLDISFISFRRLFNQSEVPLNIFLKEEVIERNIVNVVNETLRLTGLNVLGYLSRVLMLDCLIINEDRHYMNIGVCKNIKTNNFYVAPCFDNGSSLFCTNWTYRKKKSLQENIMSASNVARPFSKFYNKQLNALLNLGCKPLVINKGKVDWLLNNYYNNLYSDEINNRIKEVLTNRLDYYKGRAFIFY